MSEMQPRNENRRRHAEIAALLAAENPPNNRYFKIT